MKYRKLGTTGFEVSRIVFGCWELGGGPWELTSDESNVRILRSAFEHGVTTFDTAEGYGNGHSEQIVGQALEAIRRDCIIATKVSPTHLKAADVRKSVEASLRNLKTDYLDICYIHWPNKDIPLEETMEAFNKLKSQGLIRAIGVSNFSLEQIQSASALGRVDVLQPEYSLLQRDIEKGTLQYCIDHSISVMSYSSIAKGILSGAFHGGTGVREGDFRATRRLFSPEHLHKETGLIDLMREIAATKRVTLSQIAIAWLLNRQGLTSAIVGTQSEHHLLENLGSIDVGLMPVESESLDRVSATVLESL